MNLTDIPVPAAGIETAYLDGEAVLYDVESGRPLLLNPTGSAVWMLLDGESSLADIRDTVVEIFGADPAVVERDVTSIVTRFGELGLLDGVPSLVDLTDERGHPLVTGGALAAPPVP